MISPNCSLDTITGDLTVYNVDSNFTGKYYYYFKPGNIGVRSEIQVKISSVPHGTSVSLSIPPWVICFIAPFVYIFIIHIIRGLKTRKWNMFPKDMSVKNPCQMILR